MIKSDHQKEVKVVQNAAHVKDKYTFHGAKNIPHFAHLRKKTYSEKKYLFCSDKEEAVEKWIIILNWIIAKKIYVK